VEGSALQLDASGRLPGSPGDYPVEDRLRIRGGPVDGQIALSRLLHRQDPLDAIPQPLRSVIRWSVSMEPHQLWATAPFELSVRASRDASPEPLRGEGVAAVYFLSPE
jgi:hypothetical protein